MKIKDSFKIKDNVHYVLRDAFGNIKYDHISHNTSTVSHDALIANRMSAGIQDALIAYGHAGTGSGQGASDNNLDTACAENRTAITSITQGTGGDDNDVVIVYTLGAGVCTATLTEAGLFQTITHTNTDMQFYDDSINIPKGASDTLTVTWTITYGAS